MPHVSSYRIMAVGASPRTHRGAFAGTLRRECLAEHAWHYIDRRPRSRRIRLPRSSTRPRGVGHLRRDRGSGQLRHVFQFRRHELIAPLIREAPAMAPPARNGTPGQGEVSRSALGY